MGTNLPAMQETRVSVPVGRSLGEGNGNPLQYSCLENFMDRRAWQQALIHRITKSWTQLSDLHTHTHTHTHTLFCKH